MNRKYLIFLGIIVLILICSLIISSAKKEEYNDGNKNYRYLNSSLNKELKINYGRCVANATKESKICYLGIKRDYKSCLEEIKNSTQLMNRSEINHTIIKEYIEHCRIDYKRELENCKRLFKESKDRCLEEYKCKRINYQFNRLFKNSQCSSYNNR
ncbi:MAG: hypothetical protein QXJ28_02220 [Candidatus Pacearchaeota archaeon]